MTKKEEQGLASPLDSALPWMVYEAIHWLEAYLRRDMRVLEWGSGGSTVFFAQRVAEVVSVEHNRQWYKAVAERLRGLSLTNVTPMLRCPEVGKFAAYSSSRSEYRLVNFHDYVVVADRYDDGYFDVVLVDGRARNACMRHGAVKVKRGGVLVLDNSERPEYREGRAALKDWSIQEFKGQGPGSKGTWCTMLAVKP